MISEKELSKILPQHYPFRLIDRVVEIDKGKSLVAVKNITANEWWASGQDGQTEFPDVLLVEAAAQAALVLDVVSKDRDIEKSIYFLGKIRVEYFSSVKIGDALNIEVEARKILENGGYVDIHLSSASNKVADVQVFYSVQQKSKS